MGALLSAWTPSSPGEGLVCLRGGYLEHSPLCMCVCLLGGGGGPHWSCCLRGHLWWQFGGSGNDL